MPHFQDCLWHHCKKESSMVQVQAQHGAGTAWRKRTIPFSPCYIGPIKNENKWEEPCSSVGPYLHLSSLLLWILWKAWGKRFTLLFTPPVTVSAQPPAWLKGCSSSASLRKPSWTMGEGSHSSVPPLQTALSQGACPCRAMYLPGSVSLLDYNLPYMTRYS